MAASGGQPGFAGRIPYAYLKDILSRLPAHKDCRIGELLPHR
jgi:hypothetical protein